MWPKNVELETRDDCSKPHHWPLAREGVESTAFALVCLRASDARKGGAIVKRDAIASGNVALKM